jgi:hypothetical protein
MRDTVRQDYIFIRSREGRILDKALEQPDNTASLPVRTERLNKKTLT